MNNNEFKEIERLNFEDILWVIFVGLSILNIFSNNCQKEYVRSKNKYYEDRANKISIFVLTVLLLVYIYFFLRNYNMLKNKERVNKEDRVKLFGSFLFVVGVLCLLYFQVNSEDNFIDDALL